MLTDRAPQDIVSLMGNERDGYETGVNGYGMATMMWHGIQQLDDLVATVIARVEQLENA